MNSELRDACISVVNRAEGPMTAAQIASAARGGKGQSAKLTREVAEALAQLTESSNVVEWPRHGRSRIFWKHTFRSSVETAFLKALDLDALTVAKAAKPVSKLFRLVSEERALAELKVVAPHLAAARQVLHVALNRQSVIYMSFSYVARLIPPHHKEGSIEDAVFASVERLQSGPGNYVRIDHLRNMPELRRVLDDAALALTRKGKLVLARYDGPRPVPEEEKWNYIEDERGDLFIGAAVPRGERVLA